MVTFEPSELVLSADGDLLYAVDYRWPIVAVAEVASLSARILAEMPVDTLVAGRSGGLVGAGPDVVVAPSAGGSLIRVDPTGTVAVLPAPASPRKLVRQRSRILGVAHGSGVLTVLEDARDRVTEIEVGVSLTGLAATHQWIWVTDDADGSVSVMSADTFEVAHRFDFPGVRAGSVCAVGDRAWVEVAGPGCRIACLAPGGRRVWELEVDRLSGSSVSDGRAVWTAGRLDEGARDFSGDPRTWIGIRDAVSGAGLGEFAVPGQVRGMVLTVGGLLVHGFVRTRQAHVARFLDPGTGRILGELDTSGIDLSRFWPPAHEEPPELSTEEFRSQLRTAVLAGMTTPGTAYDGRTDRPIGPTNPVTEGFAHVRTFLEGDDVVVLFRWRDGLTVYGIRADIDGLTHSWGPPTPTGAAGVLAVSLMEFLDTGGVDRAARIAREDYVELTGD